MRRIAFILILLFIHLTVCAQYNDFGNPVDQKALKHAVEIIKKFYPADELCVSDIISCTIMFGSQIDGKTNSTLSAIYNIKIVKDFEPIKSEYISTILSDLTCDCDKSKYVINFNEPCYGILMCDVLPVHSSLSGITIDEFLFRYNSDGDIIQVCKNEVYLF